MSDDTNDRVVDNDVYDETVTYRDGLLPVLRNMKILIPEKGKSYMPDMQKKVIGNIVSMADGDEGMLHLLIAYYAEHAGMSKRARKRMKTAALSVFVQVRAHDAVDKQLEERFIREASS